MYLAQLKPSVKIPFLMMYRAAVIEKNGEKAPKK